MPGLFPLRDRRDRAIGEPVAPRRFVLGFPSSCRAVADARETEPPNPALLGDVAWPAAGAPGVPGLISRRRGSIDVLCCVVRGKRFLCGGVLSGPGVRGRRASTEAPDVEVHAVLPALSRACHRKPESVSRPAMATASLNGGPKLASAGGSL